MTQLHLSTISNLNSRHSPIPDGSEDIPFPPLPSPTLRLAQLDSCATAAAPTLHRLHRVYHQGISSLLMVNWEQNWTCFSLGILLSLRWKYIKVLCWPIKQKHHPSLPRHLLLQNDFRSQQNLFSRQMMMTLRNVQIFPAYVRRLTRLATWRSFDRGPQSWENDFSHRDFQEKDALQKRYHMISVCL